MRMPCRPLPLLVLVLTSAGATLTGAQTAPTATAAATTAVPTADPVIAQYDGGSIRLSQVRAALDRLPPAYRQDPARVREAYQRLLNRQLLAEGAKVRGYGEHPDVLEAGKRQAVQQMLWEQVDQAVTPATVSPEAVEAYFTAHLAEFAPPALRRASYMWLPDRKEANNLLHRLRQADLKAFRRAAQQLPRPGSEHPQGGDLPLFDDQGRIFKNPGHPPVDEPLVKAAFSIHTAGTLYGRAIPYGEGFALLMVSGVRAPVARTLQDAAPEIREHLVHEERQRALERLITQLKARFKPQVTPEPLTLIDLSQLEASDTPRTKGLPQHFPHGDNPNTPVKPTPPAKKPASAPPAKEAAQNTTSAQK